MFCQRCGKPLPDGAKFCNECGTRQNYGNTGYRVKKRKNIVNTIIVAVAAVICVAAVSFAVGMAVVSNKEEPKAVLTEADVNVVNHEEYEEPVSETASESVSKSASKPKESKEYEVTENKTDNGDVLLSMNSAERREVNIFLSNFSEAGFGYYDPVEYVNDSELISFAFRHNSINSYKKTVYRGGDMGISAENVDITLKRFFGRTVPHVSTGTSDLQKWTYTDGMFLTPAADGESCAYFSIATEMTDNGNGTYTVNFNVYFDEERVHDEQLDEWYTYTVSQANSRCTLEHKGEAVVKPKKHNGSDTYELVSYFTYTD